jgi:hypothetical protein
MSAVWRPFRENVFRAKLRLLGPTTGDSLWSIKSADDLQYTLVASLHEGRLNPQQEITVYYQSSVNFPRSLLKVYYHSNFQVYPNSQRVNLQAQGVDVPL